MFIIYGQYDTGLIRSCDTFAHSIDTNKNSSLVEHGQEFIFHTFALHSKMDLCQRPSFSHKFWIVFVDSLPYIKLIHLNYYFSSMTIFLPFSRSITETYIAVMEMRDIFKWKIFCKMNIFTLNVNYFDGRLEKIPHKIWIYIK